MKKPILFYLSFVAATCLALCSAGFSVYGLSILFAGAGFFSIFAFSSLEFAKIIALSVYYVYRKTFSKKLKVYYVFAVITLVFITSIGVFGFLTNAYQKTSDTISTGANREDFNIQQQKIIEDKIEIYKNQLNDYRNRLNVLTSQRTKQEERLNIAQTALNRRMIDAARKDIEKTDIEITDINKKLDSTINLISKENEKLSQLKNEKIDINEKNKAIDVGPLKFLSKILNKSMDYIVNFLILLLVVVFDPLAIILWLATNEIAIKNKEVKVEPEKSVEDIEGLIRKLYGLWKIKKNEKIDE